MEGRATGLIPRYEKRASYGHKTKTLADNVEGSVCVAQ